MSYDEIAPKPMLLQEYGYANELSDVVKSRGICAGVNPYRSVMAAMHSRDDIDFDDAVILCGSRAVGRHGTSSNWDFVVLDSRLDVPIQHDTKPDWVQVIRIHPDAVHKQVLGLHCASYGIGITTDPPRREDCDIPAIVEIMTGKIRRAVNRLVADEIPVALERDRATKICYEALRVESARSWDLPVTAVTADRFSELCRTPSSVKGLRVALADAGLTPTETAVVLRCAAVRA